MGWFRKQRELLELKLILEQDKLYKEAFDFWIKNTGAFIPTPMSDRALSMGLAIIHSKQNTMTRQDYITAIRNGEYCIENDDAEKLKTLLKEIFPSDPINPSALLLGSEYYLHYKNNPEYWTHTDHEPITMKSIKASTLANMKDETKIINSEQAQRIIDSACDRWSKRLAKKWSENIVLKQNIHISQLFYQEMRSACNPDQHKLFNEIFGPDVPEFKVGDFITDDKRMPGKVFEIMDSNSSNPKLRILNPDLGDTDEYRMYGAESVRHATPEEIRAAQYPPDGTPCWVWSPSLGEWVLRYANGTGSFYMNQQKSGSLMEWKEFKPFDPNNLPFNT